MWKKNKIVFLEKVNRYTCNILNINHCKKGIFRISSKKHKRIKKKEITDNLSVFAIDDMDDF